MNELDSGKLSDDSSMKPEFVNLAVREHVSDLEKSQWIYSEMAQDLYRFSVIFNDAFFNGALTTPILSLEGARINNLGAYRIGRNGFGAKNHINLNCKHLNRSKVDVLSTLLHEIIHQWQHEVTRHAGKPPYHNVEFRNKAKELGIPCDARGHKLAMKTPFLTVCQANGIEVDEEAIQQAELRHQQTAARSQSKLKKWTCGCTNVRVAVQDFEAMCLKCGRKFVRAL